jgi:hypothetical protein
VGWRRGLPSVHQTKHHEAGGDHQRREQLPHAEGTQYEAELGVRLPREFDERSDDPVSDQEDAREQSRAVPSGADSVALQRSENEKQDHPFPEGLIELRRMSWHAQWIGRENHRPWNVGRTTVQFRVDEIADSPEEQARCAAEGERVRDGPEGKVMAPREQDARRHHAEHRAMKRQSPVPDRERVERVRGILGAIVNEDVNEPSAHQHPDDEVADEGVDRALIEWNDAATHPPSRDPNSNDVSHDVHQTVPTQGERSDAEQLGRNPRIRNGQCWKGKRISVARTLRHMRRFRLPLAANSANV